MPRGNDGPELRFGFTCRHVEAIAWRAVRDYTPALGLDTSDRFEAAWGAIVECLYAPGGPVSALDLMIAGHSGLRRLKRGDLRERGYAYRDKKSGRDSYAGPYSAGSFMRYWTSPVPQTPEDIAVDKTALAQILGELDGNHQRALLALAEHGDYRRAAAALGVAYGTFTKQVSQARAVFLALWHEHEAPSRPWGHDKRISGRVHRSEPTGPADVLRSLSDIRDAAGGRARIASKDLLAALAAGDPVRYGDWDCYDLGWFLRTNGVPCHSITLVKDGRQRYPSGYWLEEITSAVNDLTADDTPVRQAA